MAISYGTYTITEVQEGSQIWTTTVSPSFPSYTFTVSNLIGDSNASVKVGDIIMYSYYRYTVLSVSADGTTVWAGNRQGFASTVYQLIVSPVTVVKDKNGIYSPYYITLTAKSKTGTNTMGNYHGRFRIETTTDNENWEIQYTSTLNEPTVELDFSELDDIVALRCSLYASGGTSTLLDQQVISVVTDGVDGNDAYTVILTNENHTFAGNTTSAIASEIECNIIAYKGTTQIAATIGTITGQPTGMTTSLLNNGTVNAAFRVSVTSSMVTKNGVLNVPITVDNKVFTKKFTYGLALDGEDGKDGGRWYSGTSITGTSTTATVFSGSGISSAVIGDMYLNTSTYNTYRCTLGGDASTAKWVYVNNIKGVHGDTGKGVSSITNQYYLSTSNTTQTGGSWSTTVPPYVEDCYYWTKSHIVWTDNTETDTTAVLDNGLTDANANAIDARKVATNYLAVDNTGIMIADMEDGEQTPSGILTGKNVFIDNDSVDIRNGQTVLSSFGNNAVIIGQYGKSRLMLSPTMISGISDVGYKNFNIISGDSSSEEETITKNGNFENESSEIGVFNGSINFSETFYYFHNITITVVFNYVWDGEQKTTNPFTLVVDDPAEDETGNVWFINGSEMDSSYVIEYGISCSVQHNGEITFLYFDTNARLTPKNASTSASYEIESTAPYSIVIETKVYKNTSYTFGSRKRNSEQGNYSFTIGEQLIASSDNQVAIGTLNNDDPNKNYAFMVGNGVYDENHREHRSNALTVDWDGNVENMGDLEVGESLIVDGSASNIPNITINKKSTNTTDYIKCLDSSLNAKFRVLGSGGVITAGDVSVGGAETVNGNLYAKGRLLYNSTSTPLFKVVTRTIDNISIGVNTGVYPNVAVNESGYTPIAITGITLGSASSGGTTYGWCIVQSFGINGQTLNFYVGNWSTSSVAKIKMVIKVLCIRTSAL